MTATLKKLSFSLMVLSLVSCSTFTTSEPTGENKLENVTSATPTTGTVGGQIAQSMSTEDQYKLSKALDNAPGKSTQWTNMATGLTYTVVPIRKINISGNPFCREYDLSATKNNKTDHMIGNACVGADGIGCTRHD